MKTLNQRTVLQAIRHAGPLSRANLAVHTGLTRPTISSIVSDLLAEGWVQEVGEGTSSGGRRPVMLTFNGRSRWVVGAEVGAGHVRAVLCDLQGGVAARSRHRTEGADAEHNLDLARRAIGDVLAQAGDVNLAGIGFALAGLVDSAAGLWRYSPHFTIHNIPVRQRFEREFGVPVRLHNDAHAAALGERLRGAGQGVDDLVAIRAGVGIGAGIILGGQLYRGPQHGAGEIGHTTVDEDGPRCSCGNYGCLEAVAGAPAIARRAVKLIQQGRASSLPDRVGGDLAALHARIIIEAARDGDALSRDIVAEAGRYLGIGIANVINVLGPSLVIIGGGLALGGDLLLAPVRETALSRALPGLRDRVRIELGQLGDEAGVLGAAAQATEDLFPVPVLR